MLLKANGAVNLKKNRKFIYLLSPSKLKNKAFFTDLKRVFSTNKISFFQLRIKNENSTNIFNIAKKVKKIVNNLM